MLYRRWAQRDDLLLTTVARFWWAQPVEVPDTGRLRDDAIGLLRNADTARARVITLVSVQLMEYFRDSGSSFSELREAGRPPGQTNPLAEIVARAVGRGELPAGPRSPRVLNLPFDLLRHDELITMRAVRDEAIAEIVEEVWLPLLRGSGA